MRRGRLLAAQIAGIAAGAGIDALVGDPRRGHPVAGFGRAAAALERRMYAPSRSAGARFAAVAVGVPVAVATIGSIATRRRPGWRFVLVAATTWAVLGGTSLRREAYAMTRDLGHGNGERNGNGNGDGNGDGDDLAAARRRVPNLCGRDPDALDEPEIVRATIESVAENTSDAQVAPLFWGAVGGLAGLVGYRAINTLDAMVGHRSARYADFGTASARLDDVANLLPSRLTAAMTVATAPLVGASAGGALSTWLRDGHRHPSPNSGQCEAAMAGALGVRLGGRNVYRGRVEMRPIMGRGRVPVRDDIGTAARLSASASVAALGLCLAVRTAVALRRRHR